MLIHGAPDVVALAAELRVRAPDVACVIAAPLTDVKLVIRLIEIGVVSVIDRPVDGPEFGNRLIAVLSGLADGQKSRR